MERYIELWFTPPLSHWFLADGAQSHFAAA